VFPSHRCGFAVNNRGEEFEHSADAVADNRAAKVTDVHLLGDIRAGKINYDALRLINFFNCKILGIFFNL